MVGLVRTSTNPHVQKPSSTKTCTSFFRFDKLLRFFRSVRSSKDTLFQHHLPEPTGKKKYALGAKQIQKILPGQRGSQNKDTKDTAV